MSFIAFIVVVICSSLAGSAIDRSVRRRIKSRKRKGRTA